MSALRLIQKLTAKLGRLPATLTADRCRSDELHTTGSLDTLEDFLALERLLYGEAYITSLAPKPDPPVVAHKRFAVPHGRDGRALNACWELEDEISTLLKKLAPGVFADWTPRDWQAATHLAPTRWLKHLVQRGAAIRVRRLELSCRGHDFKPARITYREITHPDENLGEPDAPQNVVLIPELLAIPGRMDYPPGRRRQSSCSGPPGTKRLTRLRPGRTRRAGRGRSFPTAGRSATALRPSVVV